MNLENHFQAFNLESIFENIHVFAYILEQIHYLLKGIKLGIKP